MACLRSDIYELVAESSVLSLVSLLAPLTLGLYWKKASSTGALLSMFLGIISWLIFSFFESDWPALVPATLISFVALISGSLFWPSAKHSAKHSYDKN
jgi:solute:Na+ symporter, SSS family